MAATHVIVIDEAELICRMVEAMWGFTRPPGLSAHDALAAMDPEARAGWLRVTVAIRAYWDETAFNAPRVH